MRLTSLFRVLAGAAGLLSSVIAAAQAPVGTAFTYQGRLLTGGAPANGTYDLQFRMYNDAAAGVQVGPVVCADNITVAGGLFTVSLDFGSQFDGSARWLEIRVAADSNPGCGGSPLTLLAPRQTIGSTPNAIFAQSSWFSEAPWASSGGDVYVTGGNVGIGTSTPSNRLTVANENDANVIVGIDSGDTAAQGSILHLKDRGAAVWAVLKNAANRFAIREVGAAEDRLVINEGGNVHIGSNGSIASAYRLSVHGASGSPFPHAIAGVAYQDGEGVAGYADGEGGTGVSGTGPFDKYGFGVFGAGSGSSTWGVYSQGRFGASGTKSFQIDHPLDPSGHYLNHYCTEGPEALNVYSGNVVLGSTGSAVVELPAYFSSINRDVRYQLTCIGGYAPVYVAQEIAAGGNQFVIGGGKPELKVSWRVEATRNDPWVRAYGAPVEEAKPARAQGTYLHPELFGRPPEEAQHPRSRK